MFFDNLHTLLIRTTTFDEAVGTSWSFRGQTVVGRSEPRSRAIFQRFRPYSVQRDTK